MQSMHFFFVVVVFVVFKKSSRIEEKVLLLLDQLLPRKICLQLFLESGYWLSSSGWFGQIIPLAGNNHGKGPRKRFCASLRRHHKTTYSCRAQVSGWHISLK